MADKKKKNGFAEVSDDSLEAAAGGYVGSDKYSQQEYSKYDILQQENVWSKDRYFYKGKEISEAEANTKMAAFKELERTGWKQTDGWKR